MQASRLASAGVALQHDAVHRPRDLVDGPGTTAYTYTRGKQLLTEDGPFASDSVTNTHVNRQWSGLLLQHPAGTSTNGFA